MNYREFANLHTQLDLTRMHEELKKRGVIWLTAESCAFGQRVLFDVAEYAIPVVESFLSASLTSSAWNLGPFARSIMMTRDMARDLLIFMFTLENKDRAIYRIDHSEIGMSKTLIISCAVDDALQIREYIKPRCKSLHIVYWPSNDQPSRNGRNIHAFSGRTD